MSTVLRGALRTSPTGYGPGFDTPDIDTPDIAVVDGVLTTVVPTDADVVDVTDCIVTPGLVNAHHHLLQSAFRTLPGTRGVRMEQWLTVMGQAYRDYAVDPELCAAAAAVGVAESLLCGVTTIADHHLTWPSSVPQVDLAMATAGAAGDLGARLCVVRGTTGEDAATVVDSVHAIHTAFTELGRPEMLQLAVGPSGVHTDGPETFTALREVARDLGILRRTQSNEQVDVERAAAAHGKRPLELLAEWGWLEPGVTLAHLCGITPGELETVAASGVTVTHAPGCDVPMGWGVSPVGALLDHGVTVGLGTSGGGSNDGGHLLADARLAVQVSGLTDRVLTATEALDMATVGSAAGLGRPELGILDPGTPADLCVWDCSGVADAGVHDWPAGLLWANPGRRPRDVMVAGRWVVRDGELLTADATELAARLNTLLTDRHRKDLT